VPASKLKLPDYSASEHLRFFSCCMRVAPNETLQEWIDQKGDDHFIEFQYSIKDGEAFVSFSVDRFTRSSAELHLHINCARIEFFADDPPTPADTVGDAYEFLERFFGQTVASKSNPATVGARFSVPIRELPRRGGFGLLLGVSTSVDKSKLSISHVRSDISGDAYWREIDWMAGETSSDEAEIRLHADWDVAVLSDDLLIEVERMAIDGFNRYVLQLDEEAEHDK
jgi:hypothetical protein